MQAAIRRVLSNYATFSGRAPRAEFWWWWLAVLITLLITSIIDAMIFGTGPESGQPISMLVSLGLLLPNIAVAVRRMHDIGKSGWWLLLAFIPLIGGLILIYFYVQPSQEGSNDFGAPNPLA